MKRPWGNGWVITSGHILRNVTRNKHVFFSLLGYFTRKVAEEQAPSLDLLKYNIEIW